MFALCAGSRSYRELRLRPPDPAESESDRTSMTSSSAFPFPLLDLPLASGPLLLLLIIFWVAVTLFFLLTPCNLLAFSTNCWAFICCCENKNQHVT